MKKKIRSTINISGKCSCDICGQDIPLVTHHINGRNIPNAEHDSNLVHICPNCHYDIHLGNIILESWFMTTSGRELIWHKNGEKSITGKEAKPFIIPRT